MVKSVFDNLKDDRPRNHYVVGIKEDVCNTSLDFDPRFTNPATGIYSAMFYGLGSDGTVGANKNSIKIIGEKTDNKPISSMTRRRREASPPPISASANGRSFLRT